MADGTLKVGTITNSAGSGNITIGSGVTLQSNVPAFEVQLTSNQSIPNTTATKVQFDQTNLDTDSGWSGANYRWTPGVVGKYFFYASVLQKNMTDDTIVCYIYKNGSNFAFNQIQSGATSNANSCLVHCIDNVTATDYYEVFVYHDIGSSQNLGGDSTKRTIFGAYKIGA